MPDGCIIVSIHAPREGCDLQQCQLHFYDRCFNSRTPGGVRLPLRTCALILGMFQFTHPGRGATSISLITSSR